MSDLARRAADAIAVSGWRHETPADAATGELRWVLDRPDEPLGHPVVLVVHEVASTLTCHSVLKARVAEVHRTATMELVTRANYGLLEGRFEMDLDDGEVRFTTSAHVVGDADVGGALHHLVAFNLAVFAVYSASLEAVASGAVPARAAIAWVEQG